MSERLLSPERERPISLELPPVDTAAGIAEVQHGIQRLGIHSGIHAMSTAKAGLPVRKRAVRSPVRTDSEVRSAVVRTAVRTVLACAECCPRAPTGRPARRLTPASKVRGGSRFTSSRCRAMAPQVTGWLARVVSKAVSTPQLDQSPCLRSQMVRRSARAVSPSAHTMRRL